MTQLYRATVLKTDYKKGQCKVKFDGTGDTIDDVNVLCRFNESSALPKKGKQVLVALDGEHRGEGYIIGQFFNGAGHKPHKGTSKDKVYLNLGDVVISGKDIVINARTITIKANSVTFNTNKGVTTL